MKISFHFVWLLLSTALMKRWSWPGEFISKVAKRKAHHEDGHENENENGTTMMTVVMIMARHHLRTLTHALLGPLAGSFKVSC